MGNPKQKWTEEEENALRAGIDKHGPGKWKNIQKDPEFNHLLHSRTNIDLKDKWRNLSVSAIGQSSREISRTPTSKVTPEPKDISPIAITWPTPPPPPPPPPQPPQPPHSSPPALIKNDPLPDPDSDDKKSADAKNAPVYNEMIMDALSTLRDPNGSDTSTIFSFIEQRHELPQNFRKLLSSRLRRLVGQGKLEKVHTSSQNQNFYKLKGDTSPEMVTPVPKPEEVRLRLFDSPVPPTPPTDTGETLEAAALTAAYRIAEAENKAHVASEAVKEAERVSKMAEESEANLMLAQEIYDKCSTGEILFLA